MMFPCDECGKTIAAYPCACGYGATLTPIRPTGTRLYHSLPQGCTKEEFGVNLYETIVTIGGILGLDEQRALAINAHEGYKVQGLLKRRKALQLQLAQQLQQLTDTEMAQILLRYNWVVQA